MESQSDGELVRAVVNGDAEAFAPLVRRYRDAYTRFAVRMLGNREDAEDVLQSAFVRAFKRLDSCDDPERFGAWLYQIVVNECRTYLSRRNRRERRFLPGNAGGEPAGRYPWTAEWARQEVIQALDQLPLEQREAFLLKHVEELSYDEMRALTGATESALKMRVKRACERLRDILQSGEG